MYHAGLFIAGLFLLVLGGRFLVAASVDTARRLRVSPLVVGLTLVAWGTSAPELSLNTISAFKGRGDLALGNVVGANICNMALVLGIAALFKPLKVVERLIRVEVWLNALILCFMVLVGTLTGFGRGTPALMLVVFGLYSTWTIASALRESKRPDAQQAGENLEDHSYPKPPMAWTMIVTSFLGGLALLSLGGSFASDGASGIATRLGVPPAVIGVTIVAIGTTLPELITSLLAVKNNQTDLAMGNALGSCLFNAGAIFGMTGLLAPPAVERSFLLPMLYMAGLALALIPISRTFQRHVSRLEGALLLVSYAGFLVLSAMSAR
jgi:cation:H+ antiporter